MTNSNKELVKTDSDVGREQAGAVYMPAIDICENNENILLTADMPGADQESVNVSVENGVLRIEGKGSTDKPEGYELIGQEYELGRFRREFTLSDKVEVEGIKAKVKNGVLEVLLPKSEKVKTRKIEITN